MYVLVKYLRINRNGMFLLEKVEVLDKFDWGMSTAVVTHQYGEHQSTIKKNECKNFFHRKIERSMCVWLEDGDAGCHGITQ